MGFFDGLFGGGKTTPDFRTIGINEKLPAFLRGPGRDIATGSFNVFRDLIDRGETDAETELFSRSRTASIKDFEDTLARTDLDLGRIGAASSGARDRQLAALSLGLGDILTRQDAQRAAQLLANRERGATQGLNAVLATANQSSLVPFVRQRGLFDGLGTRLVGEGVESIIGGAKDFAGGFARGLGLGQ